MKMNQWLTIGGMAAALFWGAGNVSAQALQGPIGGGGSNPDPAQQRFMKRAHDGLAFTNETDWNNIQPLVQAVFDAQRDVLRGGSVSRMAVPNRNANSSNAVPNRVVRTVFFGQPSPEALALQRAIDDDAPAAQIKTAMANYRASQKAKQEKLVQAQENLRKHLSPKQEAQALLLKLLD